MQPYAEMSTEELHALKKQLSVRYRDFQGKDLRLDMSRGKPSVDQLDLSMGMMDVLSSDDDLTCDDGTDCRNYGVLTGIGEAKELIGDMMEASPDNIIIYGNSSLNVMFDTVSRSMTHGVMGCTPWCKLDQVKFLCPVPGYDRHFAITEYFGIEMINVPMSEEGPDMDMVEELVASDDSIKGIWCVPKYSNPDGFIYSDGVIGRIAGLKPAAPDFVVMWDNAYCVHEIRGEYVPFPDILKLCAEQGNPDLVIEFASTSKVTLPGAGMAVMAASEANIKYLSRLMEAQTISCDKMNQLRQVRFLKDKTHTLELMKKHAQILRPRFDAFLKALEEEIRPLDIARWTEPMGGYFISLYTAPGCAKRTVALCKEAGLVMTGAGAAYPYGRDPEDSHIRIAPSFPALKDVELAAQVFCTCLKLAALERQGSECET